MKKQYSADAVAIRDGIFYLGRQKHTTSPNATIGSKGGELPTLNMIEYVTLCHVTVT